MTSDNISDRLKDILPDLPQDVLKEQTGKIHKELSATALARIQLAAKKAGLAQETIRQQKEALAAKHNMRVEDLAPDDTEESLTAKEMEQLKKAKEEEERRLLDNIDKAAPVDPLDINEVTVTTPTGQVIAGKDFLPLQTLQGSSRPEIAKLMTALGINLSVRLSKTDTANLLACLMTCNETQLRALLDNDKMPMALKAIIRRILMEAKLGDTSIVMQVWDRLFGKGPMSLDATPIIGEGQAQSGLIPDQPISREAYIIIRDTLMK